MTFSKPNVRLFFKAKPVLVLSLLIAIIINIIGQTVAMGNDGTIRDITIQPGTNEFSRNFAWYANSNEQGQVQLARASYSNNGSFPVDNAVTFNAAEGGRATFLEGFRAYHVTASGLEPNTEYVYRVGNGGIWSNMHSFRTGASDNFSFVFVGDPQLHNHTASTAAWQNNINRALARWPEITFIVSAGDQIDGSGSDVVGSESHYSRLFSPSALRSLAFAPTLGNHDVAANFNSRFNMPNLDRANGLTREVAGNYFYTYGNVLFLHLNSNNIDLAQHRAFMQAAIDSNPNAVWRIAVMHHTMYGVAAYGNDTSRRHFHQLMDEFEVDIAFNGHDHIYSRSHQMLRNTAQLNQNVNENGQLVDPTGTVYITGNSASGSKYYASTGDFSAHNAFQYQSNTPNISKIDMTPNSFTINTYRSVNTAADSEFILVESFSIVKTIDYEPVVPQGILQRIHRHLLSMSLR